MPLQKILEQLDLNIIRYEPVSGGDINRAYCLFTKNEKYFLKINEANRFPAMFEKEANGLKTLHNQSHLIIPKAIALGNSEGLQFLLLEWMEKGKTAPGFWFQFGTSLAQLHKKPQAYFGFEEHNYIGSLLQKNNSADNWEDFYTNCRIIPLVKRLYNEESFSKSDIYCAESFCQQISSIFPNEPPALLHGDLWAGNYMVLKNGYATIYDPAVYYGHREMDIGMTKLFGGFSPDFYEAYHSNYPLECGWQQRIIYTQLYPLLVHAILFGGHYVSSAREILKPFG
jgi:fructosamine-3-kinase